MRHLRFRLCLAICGIANALGVCPRVFGAIFTGVGVYDESLTILAPNTTPNQVDTNAAPGVGVGTNLSVSQFSATVLSAYNTNRGGVCTFEHASLTTETSYDVIYGPANQTLTVTLTTVDFQPPLFSFRNGDDGGAIPISGSRYLENATSGAMSAADFGLTFSQPLAAWGYTALSRTGIARTVNSLKIVLEDDSTYVFSGEVINVAPGGGLNGLDDTFFGYAAPAGHFIVGVSIDVSMMVRWDDMGFITYTPPPPGDFDGDGDVDGADFVVWQTNFPASSGHTLATGDADNDGDVDGADFVVWQTHFPFTPGPGASPVPEPNSMLLIAIATFAVHFKRRR